ncbi:MAG: hypothetical protein V3V84_02475 [Candidatus Bathyarchaeia archaeon]
MDSSKFKITSWPGRPSIESDYRMTSYFKDLLPGDYFFWDNQEWRVVATELSCYNKAIKISSRKRSQQNKKQFSFDSQKLIRIVLCSVCCDFANIRSGDKLFCEEHQEEKYEKG